ncbi:hypothetical protein GX50_01118 [[Emmonsia] crescens]|uniref:Protein kinase domain-containing protein n=1 Tax=[Emmonsia] crescens TaxID=73230 RepID=A0A2B7ZQ21_9EURO|nr:hypothetical protein GX50_01118 [Emmonsia crescens]
MSKYPTSTIRLSCRLVCGWKVLSAAIRYGEALKVGADPNRTRLQTYSPLELWMVFNVGKEQLEAKDSWRHVLRRHISYFGDEDSLNKLLTHIGKENDFFFRFLELAGSFTPGDLRQPFTSWNFVDPELRDLVGGMTNLDPRSRITAREALEHPWFSLSK